MTLSWREYKGTALFWVLAAGTLVSDAAFYRFALNPREEKLALLENEYRLRRVEKEAAEGPAGIDMELKGIYSEIPGWEDFTKVMGEVYNKAESLNLLVESASYKTSSIKGSGMVKVDVSMPVTGSYGEIKRFIYEMETSPRLFIIQDLSLAGGREQAGDISLKLTIAAYFRG